MRLIFLVTHPNPIFSLNTQSSATVKNSFSRPHFYLSCFSFSTSTGPHPASFRSSWSYTMLLAVALTEAGAAEQFSGPLVSALGIGGTNISLICPSSLHPFDSKPMQSEGSLQFLCISFQLLSRVLSCSQSGEAVN